MVTECMRKEGCACACTHTYRREGGREGEDRHQEPDLKSLISTNLHFIFPIYDQIEEEANARLNLTRLKASTSLGSR